MGRKRKIKGNPMHEYVVRLLADYFAQKNKNSHNMEILNIIKKLNSSQDMINVKNKLTLNILDRYTKYEIINSFMEYLPTKKKHMLEMKYSKKYPIVKIQMELNVSADWINRWSKILIDILNDAFCYHLDKMSIIACSKVQSMIRIIDIQLYFLENKNLISDISLDYIIHLRELQKNYMSIYQKLREYLESDMHEITNLLIQALNEKYYTVAELGELCFCAQSTIGIQIRNLQRVIAEEYNAISYHCSNIHPVK